MIRSFNRGEEEYIIHSHYNFYNREYNFDLTFKEYIEQGVTSFIKNFDEEKDNIWVIEENGQLKGTIAISHITQEQAQLRWYLLDNKIMGQGYGKQLLLTAINFCKEKNYESIILWTNNRLTQARRLYNRFGFILIESKEQYLSNQLLVTECLRKHLADNISNS
jgi:N-acetylglutamate synthase-like GNAT family acetyltransferase